VDFELRVSLVCDAAWVKCPEHLVLMADGRSFEIVVDASELTSGVHTTTVVGRNAQTPGGVLFCVPITVVKPIVLEAGEHSVFRLSTLRLGPADTVRSFLVVPDGATHAEVTIRTETAGPAQSIMLHCVQLLPQQGYTALHLRRMISLTDFAHESSRVAVRGGGTLEVCLAKFWNSPGDIALDVEVVFHGVSCLDQRGVFFPPGDRIAQVVLVNSLRKTSVNPSAVVNRLRKTLRPKTSTISRLTNQLDTLSKGKLIYELRLEYSFKTTVAGKYSVMALDLHPLLYDSPLTGNIWCCLDANNQVMGWGGAKYEYPFSLPVGDHSLVLALRSDDPGLLDKTKSFGVALERRLEGKDEIALTVHATAQAALTGGASLSARPVLVGGQVAVWVALPADDALPKDAGAGDSLVGRFEVNKGVSVAATPLVVALSTLAAKTEDKTDDSIEETQEEKTERLLLKAKVDRLKTLGDSIVKDDPSEEVQSAHASLVQSLHAEAPDHLPFLLQLLRTQCKRLPTPVKQWHPAHQAALFTACKEPAVESVIGAADRIIAQIDTTKLAEHFGTKVDKDEPEEQRRNKKLVEERDALVEALTSKALAVASKAHDSLHMDEADRTTFLDSFREVRKWIDTTETKHARLHAIYEFLQNRPCLGIKVLNKAIDNKESVPAKELFFTRGLLYRSLGWNHLEHQEWDRVAAMFPLGKPIM